MQNIIKDQNQVKLTFHNFVPYINGQVLLIQNEWEWEKGNLVYGLIWWAAKILDKKFFENNWGNQFKDCWDAKICMTEENAIRLFQEKRQQLFESIELDPRREIIEELCHEIIPWVQDYPILDESDLNDMEIKYIWESFWIWIKDWIERFYTRFLYEIRISQYAFEKLLESPIIYLPTEEELFSWELDDWRIWENTVNVFKYLNWTELA